MGRFLYRDTIESMLWQTGDRLFLSAVTANATFSVLQLHFLHTAVPSHRGAKAESPFDNSLFILVDPKWRKGWDKSGSFWHELVLRKFTPPLKPDFVFRCFPLVQRSVFGPQQGLQMSCAPEWTNRLLKATWFDPSRPKPMARREVRGHPLIQIGSMPRCLGAGSRGLHYLTFPFIDAAATHRSSATHTRTRDPAAMNSLNSLTSPANHEHKANERAAAAVGLVQLFFCEFG